MKIINKEHIGKLIKDKDFPLIVKNVNPKDRIKIKDYFDMTPKEFREGSGHEAADD